MRIMSTCLYSDGTVSQVSPYRFYYLPDAYNGWYPKTILLFYFAKMKLILRDLATIDPTHNKVFSVF